MSASLPNVRRNAPLLRLLVIKLVTSSSGRECDLGLDIIPIEYCKRVTYEEPALIQVISAAFIFKSEPIDAVTPTMQPWKKDCCPIAMVAVKTKRHSWNVELKHFGRAA